MIFVLESRFEMEPSYLALVAVSVVLAVILAVICGVYCYLRRKRARKQYEEALLHGAQQEIQQNQKTKKSWKQRLITRKTIK